MPATRVFLDAGGRAPVTRRTADALLAGVADGWADPTRLTNESRRARAVLDGAREAIADAIGADAAHLHFLPSAHVAAERVTAGVFRARRGRERIVVSAIERQAILDAADHTAPDAVDRIPVDDAGHVNLDELEARVSHPATALALIQHANQEIGTVQHMDEVAAITRRAEVPLIVDASASIGHLDPPTEWDALLADPADWGAPAGLGVLATRPRTRWLAAWPGEGWAPGGVSIPLALASAVALQERREAYETNRARLTALTDRIRAGLAGLEGVTVVGDADARVPHLLTAAFLYLDGEPVVTRLDREGFAVGSGSACGTAAFEPSHVLAAMGALTHGNLRIGLHPGVADEDVARFIATLPRVLEDVRRTMTAD
ncbi:cysteine desulfurase family protein [Demequina muriae]|uniref:Aminotransferase class V-fold PLP-dependent enzyme n=1 Tax=Demequina muriae TaxID=3051664 RepID=A0ABT8GJY5_9MICO|nr:aminotransferase class V-fold PLP-dependent enzyme [Demequina sp. EGI L300058]MDN4481549.1 aminotransferase class V-fold PLP-dependent enzyme [Demequina sp. EGI L300058]